MTIKDAFRMVRDGEKERNKLISLLFHHKEFRSKVYRYILNSGGTKDDAVSIYDDMIVQCIKTMFAKKEYDHDGLLEAYLMGIVKFLWFKERKHSQFIISEEEFKYSGSNLIQDSHESLFFTSERISLLSDILSRLRSNCKEVLMHWANGFTMEEIASKLGYLSEGMARKKKSQCMKELTTYLNSRPHLKSLLQ
ncbi:MAG TPA: sigma-70 family RNA polymerase sigma factor [Saprospiraceae bacterium]|nr:sigma-70 family RNA polymerase sigma factor [Saprospiraceae bacterium]